MTLVFILLLLLYGHSAATSSENSHTVVSPLNASLAVLHCPPAESFIQTHMSPDFMTPQLVRRLDWFHEDSLVASYQQGLFEGADSARQWWVAEGRLSLDPIFHYLTIQPVRPEDAGVYRCRLDTDPLFSLTISSATVELAVMVRPPAPSSPSVKHNSPHSVTLSWNHSSARAHQPILRFSVAVSSPSSPSPLIIPAPSNATSVVVDNLSPFTLYSFAVRAENEAGHGHFGPESKFRTPGLPPSSPPSILNLSTPSSGCALLSIQPPEEVDGDVIRYTVTVSSAHAQPSSQHFPTPLKGPLRLCQLSSDSTYTVSVVAETDYGISPPAHQTIQMTSNGLPPPLEVVISPSVTSRSLHVQWKIPKISGKESITQHNIYYKSSTDSKWKVDKVDEERNVAVMKHEIKGLAPSTTYTVSVSFSNGRTEGPRSHPVQATTDIQVPLPIEISSISFDCHVVRLQWDQNQKGVEFRVEVSNSTRSLQYNTTKNTLELSQLALQSTYRIRASAVARSRASGSRLIQGPWGEEQTVRLSDKCSYHSSVCSQHNNCQRLVQGSSSSGSFPAAVVLISLSLFVILSCLVVYSLKGRCIDVKLLRRKKEKCVFVEELSPLVYDSTGCDDIPVELFYGYCEDLQKNQNAKYKVQFEKIEQMSSEEDQEDGDSDRNLGKNRYLNIGATETSRVKLNSAADNDYINANYIDSCEKPRAYIATQAPLPSTFSDFWDMTWQERSNIIVVITNLVEDGRRKCDQYWPSTPSSPLSLGSYVISLESETTNAHFVHRILSLRIAKCVPPTQRRIHQLHFTGWPDHGVPDSVFPLLSFMNYMADIHSTGPLIVHCSAGVGRSGSFILIDCMRRQLMHFRRLNMMGHLILMRRQRQKLVQTVEQYILCHEAVRQLIRHGITRVHSDLFERYLCYLGEENTNGKTRMQMQFEDLCECRHRPRCSLPEDYIVLPGYHRLDEFIVASWPNECESLWNLVWQRSCQTIVLIGDEGYWRGLEKVGQMSLKHGEKFVLLQNEEDQLCVRIVHVSRSSLESDLWTELERLQEQRLAYHHAPLLILTPPQQYGTPSTRSVTIPFSSEGIPSGSSLSLCLPLGDSSPSLAYSLCALTSLACQLEQQGCIDAVQVLSSYSRLHCGIWSSRTDIEFIYSRLSSLVGGSRV